MNLSLNWDKLLSLSRKDRTGRFDHEKHKLGIQEGGQDPLLLRPCIIHIQGPGYTPLSKKLSQRCVVYEL